MQNPLLVGLLIGLQTIRYFVQIWTDTPKNGLDSSGANTTRKNDLGLILSNRRMHRYSNSKLREKMRRCLAGLRENVSKNHSPENTAARTLERVTWPFHVVVLAGVLNDPAEQARPNKVRLHPQTLQRYRLVNGTGATSSMSARLRRFQSPTSWSRIRCRSTKKNGVFRCQVGPKDGPKYLPERIIIEVALSC